MSGESWRILGTPRAGGVLIVSDHASNRVPDDIDLGIDDALLDQHVAVDIGVLAVAEILTEQFGYAAIVGHISRLVVDLNRDPHAPAAIPVASDGHAVPGNFIDHAGHLARIERFHTPYHRALAELLDRVPPALIVSLHSFTPSLASHPDEARPWQVGVLYNRDERAARSAIPWLAGQGLVVGDQQPYSGRLLNYTMDRHAEARGISYLGLELRQDLVACSAAHRWWAGMIDRLCRHLAADA